MFLRPSRILSNFFWSDDVIQNDYRNVTKSPLGVNKDQKRAEALSTYLHEIVKLYKYSIIEPTYLT